jgi:CO dehydrogenase maturation factor
VTYTIAVAGKGGVGKTTFSALAIRHLSESSGEVVLAVDADPNANLGAKLGTAPGPTLGSIREKVLAEEELPRGMSKQEFVDYQIKVAVKEGNGFDLLTMGRQEGPGCYCYVNNMLRAVLDSISEKYQFVVIDNEAGMEHMSRRTVRSPDILYVLSDRSKASIETARRLSSLAVEMKIPVRRKVLVVNRLDAASAASKLEVPDGFDSAYGIRRSAAIEELSQTSESLSDILRTDPTFQDISRTIEAERKRR